MTGEEATVIVVGAGILLVLIVTMIDKSKEKAKWRKAQKLDRAAAYYDRACENYMEYEGKGQEKFEDAIGDLTVAIALDPEYADAYHRRGILYDEYGKKKEALADYRKFLELSDYKTDLEALDARQRHTHLRDYIGDYIPNWIPLVDPLVATRIRNETLRDMAKERVRELESYVEKGGG